ncbi:MAG: hypothetical protein V1702_03115 [Candidatus Woesearchaeota archaeon]
MFKKAQGMSINTIIIAIIVLVVLVVLVMIFTGYFGGWTKSAAACKGTCVDTGTSSLCYDPVGGGDTGPMPGKCFTAGTTTEDTTKMCCPMGTITKP